MKFQLLTYLILALGWGITSEGGAILPRFLRFVEVPIVNDTECRASYGQDAIFDSMICAGYRDGGKDACNGDSGKEHTGNKFNV